MTDQADERVWVCDECDCFAYGEPYHKGWCSGDKATPYVPESSRERLREALEAIAHPKIVDPRDELGMDSNAVEEIARTALDSLTDSEDVQ